MTYSDSAVNAAEVVGEFIDLVTSGELESAVKLVTDECEYDNVPMGKVFGPQAIVEFLRMMDGVCDEVEFVVHRQVVSGRVVMNERTDRFRRGDVWIDLPVVGVWEIDADGRIALWRDYFDLKTMTDAMTAVPAEE